MVKSSKDSQQEKSLHSVLASYREETFDANTKDALNQSTRTSVALKEAQKNMDAAQVSYQSVKQIQEKLTDIYHNMRKKNDFS